EEVIIDAPGGKENVKRIVFCSGKVYHDLVDYRREAGREQDVALIRLEQLYPFPRARVQHVVDSHPDCEFVFCQEEPRNMGPWSFTLQRMQELGFTPRYAGRAASASPATGSYTLHQSQQRQLLSSAVD
nr:2-oxoglutarate dehydrogenase E1 component [Planctomycetota bacterium]